MLKPTTILLSLAMLASPVAAEASGAADVLRGLQAWLDGSRDLQGRFEQIVVSGALGSGLEERGELWIERPGRMRWDYREPEAKVALIRDDLTWFYLAEDEQLIRGRLEPGSDLLPLLLAGEARLDQLFEASLNPPDDGADRSGYRLRLVPRESSEQFVHIELTLGREDFSIREVEVLDAAGNEIRYRFLDLRRNEGLQPGLFVFEPPPGTLISGQH